MRPHLLFTAFLCACAIATAQTPTGEIRLEVKDPSGAPIEASGRLQNQPAGIDRTFTTDAQGMYTATALPFGRYRVELSRTGFAVETIAIDVQAEAAVTRAITMELSRAAFDVDVISTTPLPGVELSRDEIPAAVQALTQTDIANSGALDLSDFLNRRLNGVNVNEVQGNPYQPDVNYRGYTASPLLGTPQGLSVYMDGVRLNQPFGDVVSWDLIPRVVISEAALMPGSNPLFGLNTLGGALSIQTKDGRSQPGTSLELSGGNFGRKVAELEHGGSHKGFSWYAAGNLFFEDGWRQASPSDVRQFFGKIDHQSTKTTLGLTVAYANNLLTGNGLQEQHFLQRNYSNAYTLYDATYNRSPFLNFTARRILTSNLTFFGNAYYRYIRGNSFNGDLNEDSLDQSIYQPSAADIRALTAAGYTGFPLSGATAANTPFPFWRCIAQVLQKDEPAEKCNGLVGRTHTAQHNGGVAGQLSWLTTPHNQRNQFTAGASFDRSGVDFQQSTQLGYLNPDRTVTALNAFGDGVTGGSVDGEPYDTRINLGGVIRTGSVYATDTLSVGSLWNLTLSGRYNRTTVGNTDRIRPAGDGSLTSENAFGRFNPAVGVTFNPSKLINAYFGYNEGSRAPTSIELGCADPNIPCKLPNAMAGDPPLNQVVTRTLEAGVRGGQERNVSWSVGWFRAENHNDILFVASSQTGFGYFKNFGETRRQGVEVDINGRIRRISLGGSYTFLDATYQSTEAVDGSSNSSSNAPAKGLEGTIQIQPGARIPLIPQHLLKAFADVQITKKLSADLSMLAVSSSYARGNENNLDQPDGTYYIGPGTSPGYAVVDLGAHYQVHARVQLFVQINNLLDRHYYTAAQLLPLGFTDQATFIARPFPAVNGEFPLRHATFFAPGAPIGVTGGIRLKF